jgi:hypothetical protein
LSNSARDHHDKTQSPARSPGFLFPTSNWETDWETRKMVWETIDFVVRSQNPFFCGLVVKSMVSHKPFPKIDPLPFALVHGIDRFRAA